MGYHSGVVGQPYVLGLVAIRAASAADGRRGALLVDDESALDIDSYRAGLPDCGIDLCRGRLSSRPAGPRSLLGCARDVVVGGGIAPGGFDPLRISHGVYRKQGSQRGKGGRKVSRGSVRVGRSRRSYPRHRVNFGISQLTVISFCGQSHSDMYDVETLMGGSARDLKRSWTFWCSSRPIDNRFLPFPTSRPT